MITIYFGSPGVGKSSLLARFALIHHIRSKLPKFLRKYDRVLSNYPIKHTYLFDKSDIGQFDLTMGGYKDKTESNTLVLFDEAGVDFSARAYKLLKDYQNEHFRKHRKYREDWIVCSQVFNDMDKTIRDLAPRLYYLKKCTYLPYHIKALRLKKSCSVDDTSHQIIDGYEFDHWFIRIFTTRRFYLPFYWGLFESWDAPDLPYKEFKRYD